MRRAPVAYVQLLGRPIEEVYLDDGDTEVAFPGSTCFRFHLPIWPQFDFAVCAHPNGWAWGQQFVRRLGRRTPTIASIEDLSAWSFVEFEIAKVLGAPIAVEQWNWSRDATYLAGLQTPESSATVVLTFDYGLLQLVEHDLAPAK
jgi:hypothetical protein